MIDPLALTITDGVSRVIIADTTGSPILAPLLEISPAVALIQSDAEFEPNAYLDLTLELKGQPPRKFFAHVVGSEAKGVRIRWMHLDPGEEQKLKGLLAAYARTAGAAPAGPGHGTRRVIKPRTETFTPFGGGGEAPPPPGPPAAPAGEHRPTRRIIKPGGARVEAVDLDSDHEPTVAAAVGDESRGRPVVLAPTDKFERMRHVEEDERPRESAPRPVPPPPPHPTAVALAEGGFSSLKDLDSTPEKTASSASGRSAVVGKDGRMDVGAAIRQKAKTVRASDLAARHDKVRVLNMGTIKSLIQEAVEEAAAHLTQALGAAERKRLLEEAEEGFKERLKAFEIDKKSAEEKARLLQNELGAATQLLEQERKRAIQADQFTVSEAGLAEIDLRMAKVIERAVGRGEAGPELELKLRELIAHILDTEREKMREKELAAHSDKIALLEKKVARLAHSLDSTEKERDEARQLAEVMEKHGISAADAKSKYRIGLDDADANRARKLALMKELVEENRLLRKSLGLALIDPEVAAREAEAEAKKARDEAQQAKLEALAADHESDLPVTPVAVASPATAPSSPEPAGAVAEEEGSAPPDDPDDQVWTPGSPAAAPAMDEADERGVKRLRSFKPIEPPPLEIRPAADEAVEIAVDPDDLPWETPAAEAVADDTPRAVKRLAAVKREPPPLAR